MMVIALHEAPYSFQLCTRDHIVIGQLSYFFGRKNTLLGHFLETFPGNLSTNFNHVGYLWETFYFSIFKKNIVVWKLNKVFAF